MELEAAKMIGAGLAAKLLQAQVLELVLFLVITFLEQ